LVAELARAEGIKAEAVIDTLVLIVEGTLALAASRRDPSVAAHAAAAARSVVTSAIRDIRD
jgi:hypothetical protein